jgi:hypothetical protein
MAQTFSALPMATLVLAFLVAAFTNLLIYIAFRPFSSGLRDKILLAVLSVGVLGAIFGTILREQGPALVPVNFLISAVVLAVWMTAFHYLERLLLGGND